MEGTFANPAVLEFYRTLPFNYRDSVEEQARAIRESDPVAAYPVLPPLLGRGTSVLEAGCGTGWLSNSIAFRYGASVVAIDFNPVAIERARQTARALDLPTEFLVEDLFLYRPKRPFDLVLSLGVLHHTNDCIGAVQRLCREFVRPGGHALIGLYHKHGRRPFLDHFRDLREKGASEEALFERYRELHSQISDPTLLKSWFRDQVLHPHETQHTLREMLPVLQDAGMELVRTSINRFEPFSSLEGLLKEEPRYEEIALTRLSQNRYFPGFFVFLARKHS